MLNARYDCQDLLVLDMSDLGHKALTTDPPLLALLQCNLLVKLIQLEVVELMQAYWDGVLWLVKIASVEFTVSEII